MSTPNGRGDWRRVCRDSPCPVCGRPDWCLLAGPEGDPEAAICARTESPKRCGEAGWLHRLRNRAGWRPEVRCRRVRLDHGPSPDFAALIEGYRRCVDAGHLSRFAASLGLAAPTLERFGVGWEPLGGAWAFPMYDAEGRVVGVHLRTPGGDKFCVKGSRLGLFLPGRGGAARGPVAGPLLFAEGLSDAAALAEMGFAAVGRPSNRCGEKQAALLARRCGGPLPLAVVVADGDAPGRHGAESLARRLLAAATEVRLIAPPDGVKDVRDWYRRGGTRQDVEQAIRSAPPRRLIIRSHLVKGPTR